MGLLGRLNPTPSFPSYTGPYRVGSTDVEIPVSGLKSPSPSPRENISTIAFRVFYPCAPASQEPNVRWIPSPQREYLGAYARFLGANSAFSHIFSLLPQLLYYVSIPVHQNADVLEPPTKTKKWPVMVFSHGLGGSRNSYSHLLGSLSSHGIVVIATDHRDGSSPTSFVRDPEGNAMPKEIEYQNIPHKSSPENFEARDKQLRIRLWEMGLTHDAILKIDEGRPVKNITADQKAMDGKDKLLMFSNILDVQKPGSISWAGHSFGAATMVQFIKSCFYLSGARDPSYRPLFTPSMTSDIVHQVTPASPVVLLDLWALPTQSPATAWLEDKPMPCYTSPHGGANLLAILSEAFYKWSTNLNQTKKVISKPSDSDPAIPGPHIFYPVSSAHLSQSDFGVLFPWITTKVFGAKEPERVLKLNARAILQVLRNAHIEVADTSAVDLQLDDVSTDKPAPTSTASQDDKILSRSTGDVRDWVSLTTHIKPDAPTAANKGPGDAVVEGEVLGQVVIEPER
ncbi:hypothetical protein EJ04DRAFT_574799 [Polyplosphaeria fusca]|uniref:Putative phospholipase n=1 Tax=Polyplosphaeria fusca TaxID=682080 RepID=A0A9P4V579_9PLEO|nr:hypothetical protein EJ04DRAFT_574799 [Polyplosphaeria fusca]